MYQPQAFKVAGDEESYRIIGENPFATLITSSDGALEISHLPLLLADGKLLGHMARANPQWRSFGSQELLILFHGPHAYVTPRWYVSELNVPTWNYAVVHVYGKASLIEDSKRLRSILERSVERFEEPASRPWRFDLPENLTGELLSSIVGFEIEISRLEGKFKLSQNRSAEDRAGVLAGLAALAQEDRPGGEEKMSRRILELMRRPAFLPPSDPAAR